MCDGHEHRGREQASLGGFWENLVRGEGSLPDRLRTASRNLARRRQRRSGCCGNYGAPGC